VIAGSHMVLPALRLDGNGLDEWAEVKRGGWEGLVAEDGSSAYIAGRTRGWFKVKVRHERCFVVVGVDVPSSGSCIGPKVQ
jgi:ATP-dependent DNA ligase